MRSRLNEDAVAEDSFRLAIPPGFGALPVTVDLWSSTEGGENTREPSDPSESYPYACWLKKLWTGLILDKLISSESFL